MQGFRGVGRHMLYEAHDSRFHAFGAVFAESLSYTDLDDRFVKSTKQSDQPLPNWHTLHGLALQICKRAVKVGTCNRFNQQVNTVCFRLAFCQSVGFTCYQ